MKVNEDLSILFSLKRKGNKRRVNPYLRLLMLIS